VVGGGGGGGWLGWLVGRLDSLPLSPKSFACPFLASSPEGSPSLPDKAEASCAHRDVRRLHDSNASVHARLRAMARRGQLILAQADAAH